MKITELLSGDLVASSLESSTKPELLHELALRLVGKYTSIDPDRLTQVLIERERLGSTAIGDGIAIPHGKLSGVAQIVGLFGRHPKGIDFDSLDGRPTFLFFLLVAPEDSTSLHLKALARASRLLKDAAFRERLMAAPDAATIYRLIQEEDSKY
ncbi:MAG: PTS sugar transporter subunit IIA [Deltaproteobacteria bacterium]|nr:PTS sugar transporter subunit IIA [Deltaproteobacteria bacterium]